ncbi:MAG: hypothetical protein E7652_06400 [Ruminococcaceae bacterium]|nr:hypothetical protein [Oscillospiraceae bacterium]
MEINKLTSVWPEWKPVELIGEGSLAKVYKAVCDDTGEQCALKVISLPQNESDIAALHDRGMSDIEIISYYSETVNDIVTELKLAEALKDSSNVVKIYDYHVEERSGSIGWDILIRMELLVPMNNYMAVCPMTEGDVVKMASDICTALEFCEGLNVIHRDIKPESILISESGSFKLTDFTITKDNGQTGSALSSKGGFVYLAPEIVSGGEYDTRADVYSLGLLMYKLCNNGYMPFVNEDSTYEDRKNAVDRRLDGERIPVPENVTPELAEIIVKACAFDPAERYSSATEFKQALMAVKDIVGLPIIAVDYQTMVAAASVPVKIVADIHAPNPEDTFIDIDIAEDFTVDHTFSYDPPLRKKKGKDKEEKKNKKKLIIILCCVGAALLIALGVVLFIVLGKGGDGDTDKKSDKALCEEIITALKKDKFDDAKKLYKDFEGDNLLLNEMLIERLDDIYDEYMKAGKTEYDDVYKAVTKELDAIEAMNIAEIEDAINGKDGVRTKIEALHNSRVSYRLAINDLNAGNYKSAIEKFSSVIKTDKDNYDDAQLKLEEAKDGYRAQVIEEASSMDDAIEAVNFLKEALEVLPEDKEILDKISEYEEVYIKDVLDKVDDKVLDDDGNYRSVIDAKKDYKSAVGNICDALEIIGDNSELNDKLVEIAEQIKEEINGYINKSEPDYESAQKAVNAGCEVFEEGSDYYNEIAAMGSTIIEAEYIYKIDTALAEERFDDAKSLVEEGLEKLPDSTVLKDKQGSIDPQIIAHYLSKIDSYITNNKFSDAYSTLDEALELYPDHDELSDREDTINSAVDTYYSGKVDTLLSDGSIEDAGEKLAEGLELNSDSTVLNAKKSDIINAYLDTADALVDEYKHYKALRMLDIAKEQYPDDTSITDKISDIEGDMPKDLCDVKCPESSYVDEEDSTKDGKGNEYTKHIRFNAREEAYAEYKLDGKYTKFMAYLFTTDNSLNKNIIINIYLDGSDKAAYTYENVKENAAPVLIDLDVSGVKTMRIETTYDSLIMTNDRFIELGDPILVE